MTVFTATTIKGPFDAITADSADFTFTATSAGADTFACTGRQILLLQNSGASSRTVTITATADASGRSVDVGPYTMAAGEFAAFGVGLTNLPGWKNTSTGVITLTSSHAEVKASILTLPTGFP